MPKGFGARTYQQWIQSDDLLSFRVTVQETDLFILALEDLSEPATQAIVRYRTQIEDYITEHPEFQTSLQPLTVEAHAPPIIQAMAAAAKQAAVGPFAAVAGAMAEWVGKDLLQFSPEIIVENGGDIFAAGKRSRVFGIYAGDSPLTGKIALKIDASQMPCGVCTSSGSVGHSLSFGRADAAIVIAKSTALADTCATALCNKISHASDVSVGLKFAENTAGIDAAVVIIGDKIGAWGKVQFVKTSVKG
jgi:ApbE superfamily uncharacterized protein (UPF0280 family)